MLFRFHTGSLIESMKTVIVVNSVEELRAAIMKQWQIDDLGDLHFTYCCFDKRIGWDTYLVSATFEDYTTPCAIGHSDGIFK